ncbi:MAG: M50 family metallopeptidase [Microbacterium sp.]|uniref:M50 family metallopeptidase n=1 Tax=Microbacterium sp. TaxID=51671 RepID=UPI0039E694FD
MTVLAFVIGVVVLVVGLAVSIALHELGHLVPAKLFGVRVGQYMIGFGPTLFSRWKGETQYGVKAIPLGGYISMAGMYPPQDAVAAADDTPEAVPVGAPSASVDAAAQAPARRTPGRFFATMVQDARASNEATLQGADDDRVFYKLPVYKRIIIMLGGPVMNLLLAIVIFTILLTGIGVQTATATIASLSDCVPVSSTSSDCASSTTPAETAGLEAGDRIVSIDGTVVSTFADASAIIQASAGQQLTLVVERDGAELTLRITPVAIDSVTTDDDGDTVTTQIGFIGIRPTSEYVRDPIWTGTTTAFENVGAVASIMVKLPAEVYDTAVSLFTGAERDPNGPLSVVGAGVIAGEAAASDAPILNRVEYILGLLGSLNIALFVFNLIPLLPLDGGHVVIALWDGAKRTWAKAFGRRSPKPVDAARLVPLTFVVVVALIAMSAVLIVADLVNPISLF